MDTKEVIGRFEAERQSLALMDHRNIAKIYRWRGHTRRTPVLRDGARTGNGDHGLLRCSKYGDP
jgi:hypothetical protein